MSKPKEEVMAKWPEAMCWSWADGYVIYTHGTNTALHVNKVIGCGPSEPDAWSDAAQRLRRPA